jgi:pimeloyl-ACP methyl ester carboxylesterase
VIAGARLAGADRGRRGLSPLIFVHGVGSTAAIWDYQLDAFGRERLCAAVELRGNGAGKPDPDPSSIDRAGYADDVLAIADALGIERFTLVGCSLGGVVAFELWRRAPERIGALLVLGSFARYPDGARYAEQIVAQVRELNDMRAFGELRAKKLGLPPARFRETVEQFACKSVDCFVAATQATWTGDYSGLLRTIDVPTLVAYGEHDAVAPRPLAQEIAGGIAGSRMVEIADAGHVANADNAADFNRLLKEFVR